MFGTHRRVKVTGLLGVTPYRLVDSNVRKEVAVATVAFLKLEATGLSGTWVCNYQSARRHILGDRNLFKLHMSDLHSRI